MIKRPIILAAALALLVWVFAAAPVEAGGRKFGRGYGGRTWRHYGEHSIQWRGHSTYPRRYLGLHQRWFRLPPVHKERFYRLPLHRRPFHHDRHRHSQLHRQRLYQDLLLGLLHMTLR